jgi:negative regulator of flagellin synthesis FlgM
MVDAISSAGGAGDPRIAAPTRIDPVVTATPVAAPTPTPTPTPTPSSNAPQLAALAKAVAASAPVDTDRVERIKAALANGTFPILPATIADRMLSFRYEWMSHDTSPHDAA